MKVFVTGCAGFIGMHVALRLMNCNHQVVGIDNLNDYYDVELKLARLAQLENGPQFEFSKIDIVDRDSLVYFFEKEQPEIVIHLAAQAGVRYSVTHPNTYIDANLLGFGNVLEGCRHAKVKHLIYASSSSVYGGNDKVPFSEGDRVDFPVSLYAATKKANELMAHSYSHIYRLPTTGLRFFTVYGPWGRPDMSPFLFTRAILEGRPIDVFNYGEMMRDFTYIDDVVDGVLGILNKSQVDSNPDLDPPYKIFNIGNNSPVLLTEYIDILESAWGKTAQKKMLPMQLGDVPVTMADTTLLEEWVGFKPSTSLEEGIKKFVEWYKIYYKVASQ
jgi:UDP-glucuronate 4-epimerase